MSDAATTDSPSAVRWHPLEPAERRVMGVLIEKAKTTPENYPLSLNAIRTGANQKSNRSPLMQLDEEQVEEALESLRQAGAVSVIQGSGRVDKYRHLAYDWLGVEKVELAVMAELLLRGAQTEGELRGRASRMEPIKDLGELRPLVDSLKTKKLISYLTPPGRGAVLSHTLYQDRELEKLRREASASAGSGLAVDAGSTTGGATVAAASRSRSTNDPGLAAEVDRLKRELADVRSELAAARDALESTARQLRQDLDDLQQQLGN